VDFSFFQPAIDIIMAVGWFLSNVWSVITYLVSPISFIVVFLTNFLTAMSNMPAAVNLFVQDSQILAFFQTLPDFSIITMVISGLIIFVGTMAIIKLIKL
jgi:hypothetical protein